MKVIDINSKLEQRRKDAELAEMKDFFTTRIMPYLSTEELMQVREAIINKDQDTYLKITEPIIMRHAIREAHEEMRRLGY